MYLKNKQGGILLYVLIVGIVISIFTSILTTIFGSVILNTKTVKNYFHQDYAMQNIVTNSLVRYINDYTDENIYKKQINLDHSFTRYSSDEIVFLIPSIANEKKHQWEFNKTQLEQVFYSANKDKTIFNVYNNDLDKIKTWKIFWQVKDTNQDYNPLGKDETTRLKISLERIGIGYTKKCFITTGNNSTDPIFNKEIVLTETTTTTNNFYKNIDQNIDSDCTTLASDDLNLPVLNEGYLDFINNSYILTIEALDKETHVKVNAIDIEDKIVAIPTNKLTVKVNAGLIGKNLEYTAEIPNCFDNIQNRDERPEPPNGGINHNFDNDASTNNTLELGTYVIKSQELLLTNPKIPLTNLDILVTSNKPDLITITNPNFSFDKNNDNIIVWAKYEVKRASANESDQAIVNIKYKNSANTFVNIKTDIFIANTNISPLVLDEKIPDYCGGIYCSPCPSYPDDISDLKVDTFFETEVSLSWSKPIDNGAIITDYIIKYNDGVNYYKVNNGNTTTATISDLLPATIYTFSVSAVNKKGEGSSNFILVPNIPNTVLNLKATVGNGLINLAWDEPTNNGLNIIDYIIKYGTDGVNYQIFDDGISTDTIATVNGLTNGTLYYFSVIAVNSLGEGLNSVVQATPSL